MRALLASPLGFLIGVSLGALGGGGSILAVPALVYVAGEAPKEAITTSLVVVGVTALAGMLAHWRAGHVRLGQGAWFGAAGIGGAVLGTALNHSVDEDVLLLAFAGLMLIAAWRMYERTSATAPSDHGASGPGASEGEPPGGPAKAPGAVATRQRSLVRSGTAMRVLLAGSMVGLITGFFGVGGGFVIVPALVLVLGFEMDEAVGTSLLVISINAGVALLSRLGTTGVEWGVAIPFTVAGLLGVSVGTKVAERVSTETLKQWFVGLLLVLAAVLAGTSTFALVSG